MFPILERIIKFTGVVIISVVGAQTGPELRLGVLLFVDLMLAVCLLFWQPCAVQQFNFIRGMALLFAAWTAVPSFVAIYINNRHSWTSVIVLLVGWFVLGVVSLFAIRRKGCRCNWRCRGEDDLDTLTD